MSKSLKRLDIIQRFKFKLARKDLERFYISFVLPIIEYGDALWDGANHLDTGKLDKVQIRAMRIITGATERSHIQGLYDDHWMARPSHKDVPYIIEVVF